MEERREEVRGFTTPADLTAILVAAHRAGDVELERSAKRALLEHFSIRVTFARPRAREAANAS